MEWIDRMTWYKVKNWKCKNYNNELEIEIVESEKISENEISDIVYETLPYSVIDDMIDEYYDPVDICGNNYPASSALKSTDPSAYDEMIDDCCEIKIAEIIDEMPDKPTTYHAMINQCKIYWE